MLASTNNRSPSLVIVGDYLFDPGVGLISGPSGAHYVCPQLASVLAVLVENAGAVVGHDHFSSRRPRCRTEESPALPRHIARLKRYFGDNVHPPAYIETIPNNGYRLVAPVYGSTDTPVLDQPRPAATRPSHPNRLARLVNEFRERKVCRAMLIYSLVIWLIFQVSEIVVPALGLPDWFNTMVVVLGILGFPIAAVLSWIFDLTPNGLVRETRILKQKNTGPRNRTDMAVDFALVASAIAICTMLFVSSQTTRVPEAQADPLASPGTESAYSGSSGDNVGGAFHNST